MYSLKKGGIQLKKIFSVFLSVILILSAFSVSAFALTSGNYTYTIENGKAIITAYKGSETTVTIPNNLGGYEVLAIGESAFANNKNITSITISDGISEVRDSAFLNCASLAKITLPKTITRFGENAIFNTAYYNNKNNWTIRYDKTANSDLTIGNGQDTYPWEFIQADELQYIYLGTVLVRCIVKGAYSVKYDTTVIADGAFRNEVGLKKIALSSKTAILGANAFNGCTSLNDVTIENDNIKICDDAFYNTFLYNTEGNWKGDVLCVGTRAVATIKNANEIVISNGVTAISNGIIGTKNVYIPSTVTKISDGAFVGNTSVIYGYTGTFAESFANENGFTFVCLDKAKMGDLDFDGEITANDYAMLHSSNTYAHKITKYESKVSDLNLDGVVDGFDEIQIQILINDKTAYTKGDVNGDGIVDENDYQFLIANLSGNCKAFGNNMLSRADLNGDGIIDGFDAIYLDLYLNGKASL